MFLPFRCYLFVTGLLSLTLSGCNKQETLFTLLPPSQSGINFQNSIKETPEMNVMKYEYLYNGGGVASGDFNNDGRPDLYFTGNAVKNRLYLNKGNLKFTDITDQAGVSGRQKWKTGVSTADVNGDGWLDIYVCYSGPVPADERSNELYINNGLTKSGIPTFTEQAKAYGLEATGTYSTHASFFDYDKDGDLDMFLLNHGNRFYSPFFNTTKLRTTRHPQFGNRLYRNDAVQNGKEIKYTEVSDTAGIRGGGNNFGLSVSVSDVNEDGWPDIYVTNDYEEQDFFYLNNRNGTFTEATKQAFGHLSRFGMGSDIADYNNDLRPDVLVMDMLPEDNHRQKLLKGPDEYNRYQVMVDSGYHHQNMRNTLQLNQGVKPNGTPVFSEIGQLAGVSNTDWSWAPLLADYDNDGFKDLYVTNGYLRDFTNMDFLKYNVEEAKAKAYATGKDLPMYELIGQMPATKTSNYIFRNNHNLTFSNQTKAWGLEQPDLSFGALYCDLDQDGDLDLVTNNTNEKASVWENHAREQLPNQHYLQVKLLGSGLNTNAIGAKIYLDLGHTQQMQELILSRGYQSAMEPMLHFGLGAATLVKQVKVIWPNDKVTILHNVKANQLLSVRENAATAVLTGNPEENSVPLFKDITHRAGLTYKHQENLFVDFDREPLIPYQLSRLGPFLAQGDVNQDGREDFFVGGAAGQAGRLFIMEPNGTFKPTPQQPWNLDAASEDLKSVFFDADSDGDLDLYVVSGGNEFLNGAPEQQDRLYLNGGKGNFTKAPVGALPTEYASGSCVAAADYDRDGDLDLFVGGRSQPGSYPLPSPGGILRNDTDRKNREVKFIVSTPQVNPGLKEPGMVTDALWTDFNQDGWPDLILVGEWMPIRLFRNNRGKLAEVTTPELAKTGGLWAKIIPHDVDGDGDLDYVLGNMGQNLQWKASPEQPLEMYYADFNDDGRIDPIICHYVQGKSYPIASRDELLNQVNSLRKKYVKYAQYADATIQDIFGDQIKQARKAVVTTLQNACLENLGQSRFRLQSLPLPAQFSMGCGLLAGDFDRDNRQDILLAGNFYPFRVQYGKLDAGTGIFLKGNGQGKFNPVSWQQSGFLIPGDVRDMILLQNQKGKSYVVAAKNNDSLQVLEYTSPK